MKKHSKKKNLTWKLIFNLVSMQLSIFTTMAIAGIDTTLLDAGSLVCYRFLLVIVLSVSIWNFFRSTYKVVQVEKAITKEIERKNRKERNSNVVSFSSIREKNTTRVG